MADAKTSDLQQSSTLQERSRRRARGSLTADAIVEAAFAVAAGSSIDELSIPLVAKSLGVGVTSIYWHIRNRTELLDAMTDRALRRSGLPAFAESSDWRKSLLTHAREVRQTFLDNPVLAELILIRGALSPLARRLGAQQTQKAIASMIDGGLDERTAREVYAAVSELVRGSVLLHSLTLKHAARECDSTDEGISTDMLPARDDRAFELLLTSVLADVSRVITL